MPRKELRMAMGTLPQVSMIPVTLNIVGDTTIEWPGQRLTSAASTLFALALLLTLDRGKPRSRRALEALLFEEGVPDQEAAHNLRQLLYRLRRMGLEVTDAAGLLSLDGVSVVDSLDAVSSMSASERTEMSVADLTPFPGWHPKLPTTFLDWLDAQRLTISNKIKHVLLNDAKSLHTSGDWLAATKCSALLGGLGVRDEDWRLLHAESAYMLGRYTEASESVEALLRANIPEAVSRDARALRGRIARPVTSSAPPRMRGRGKPLAALNQTWLDAQSGGARLASIIGPPGIGKTRLSDEFATVVRMRGGTVLTYRCDPTARPYPLALFAHILPELRGRRGSLGTNPRHLAILERLRPTGATDNADEFENYTPEKIRSEMHDALADLVEAVSEETPLLIVVDDAHLLDRSSSAMLRGLATAVNKARLLIVTCCRPQESVRELVAPSDRVSSHTLTPLNEAESRELLKDLTQRQRWDAAQFENCIEQAGGSPFYLCALSRKDSMPNDSMSASFDVSSLGASSYYALPSDARVVLEASLLLGPLATIPRAQRLAGLDDHRLLTSLRTLEESGLITLDDHHLRGPHALLQEAIRKLIPASVEAALNRRLGALLGNEYVEPDSNISIALMAADAWLAVGELSSAFHILRQCTQRIAAAGDPGEAADILSRIASSDLSPTDRDELLRLIVHFGRAGGRRALVASTLRDIHKLLTSQGVPKAECEEVALQIIEADALEKSDFEATLPAFKAVARSSTSDEATRHRAAMHVLIAADMSFDRAVAESVARELGPVDLSGPETLLGAQLVYHTVFGDVQEAYRIADRLLANHPEPTADERYAQFRRLAAFSYCRLQRLECSRAASLLDYNFLAKTGNRSMALSAASMLTETAISAGDFSEARYWFDLGHTHLRGLDALVLAPRSGYVSSASLLAMLDGRYEDAANILLSAAHQPYQRAPRNHGIWLALRLRANVMGGDKKLDRTMVTTLTASYERAKGLGGLDTIAEILWCAFVLDREPQLASQFLNDYLTKHRKEIEKPEWLLHHTTLADEVWQLPRWSHVAARFNE